MPKQINHEARAGCTLAKTAATLPKNCLTTTPLATLALATLAPLLQLLLQLLYLLLQVPDLARLLQLPLLAAPRLLLPLPDLVLRLRQRRSHGTDDSLGQRLDPHLAAATAAPAAGLAGALPFAVLAVPPAATALAALPACLQQGRPTSAGPSLTACRINI